MFLYHKNTSQNATKKQDDIMVNRIKKLVSEPHELLNFI